MARLPDALPDDVESLRAAVTAKKAARLKPPTAKLAQDGFGASSERDRKLLDRLEFEPG